MTGDAPVVSAATSPGQTARLLAEIAGAGRQPDSAREADTHLAQLARDPLAVARFLHDPTGPAVADRGAAADLAWIASLLAGKTKPRQRQVAPAEPRRRGVSAAKRHGTGRGRGAALPPSATPFEPTADDIVSALDHAAPMRGGAAERKSTGGDAGLSMAAAILVLLGAAAALWLGSL